MIRFNAQQLLLYLRGSLALALLIITPVVAVFSVKEVAAVEPLVAAGISTLGLIVPLITALIFSGQLRDRNEISGFFRPLIRFLNYVASSWGRTLLTCLALAICALASWNIGAGSLRRFAFSCYEKTSVTWKIGQEERLQPCSDAEIVRVWIPPSWKQVLAFWRASDQSDQELSKSLDFQCAGGGLTLPPYPPGARDTSQTDTPGTSRTEWLCANNRCPADMAYVPGGFGREIGVVKPVCLDRTLVTAGEFATCKKCVADEQGYSSDWPDAKDEARGYRNPNCTLRSPIKKSNDPINCVDFTHAELFCESKSRRLPTAQEWYWASRGADSTVDPFVYPWGTKNTAGRICGPHNSGPCAVGSYRNGASPNGVFDLVGDVWQWTDTVIRSEMGELGKGVVGGAWGDAAGTHGTDFPNEIDVRPSPYWAEESVRSNILGFRCAVDPEMKPSGSEKE